MDYVGRAPIIINYTITAANTWEQATAGLTGVRKWLIKSRESTYESFDFAFTSAPTTYMTNSGVGLAFDNCELPPIYVRSAEVGTVVEILYWN